MVWRWGPGQKWSKAGEGGQMGWETGAANLSLDLSVMKLDFKRNDRILNVTYIF